jgi:SAM-dependent methyltransferase
MVPRVTCPACGGELAPWRRAGDNEPASAETRLLLRCARCGTARTAGDAPAAAHETGAYAPGAPRGARVAAPLLRAFDRRRMALLGDASGPLLDVGAGRGRFVAYARAHGFPDATGIEPSPRATAPHVEAVALEDASYADLGAITLWHVLEHVEDPAAALARLRGWLRPGGTLLVGVPDLDSLQARIGGPRWYHLDLPRHRTHFTAGGLTTLLERSGFTVDHVERRLLEHNPFGLWQSAVSRVTPTPSWLYHALKRNAPLRAADAVPTALALPLLPLVVAARPRGTVAVRALA